MSEGAFAIVYGVLWAGFFLWLFRLGRQSRRLQETTRAIKRNLHSGWPDPEE